MSRLGFVAAFIACACALVFGFVPALQNSRVDLVSVINEDASPRGAGRHRLRATLAATTDPRECEALLDAETRLICEEMQRFSDEALAAHSVPAKQAAA